MKSVESFSPDMSSKASELLAYPFKAPEGSYLTDGREVIDLPDEFEDFVEVSDRRLSHLGLPLIEDRIPVVEYGANESPPRIAKKMAKYGAKEQHELQVIPKISGQVLDSAVVWHGRTGATGSTFAKLYRGADTKGETATCHVAFMSEKQFAMMHTTEGSTYRLAEVDVNLADDKTIKAYAYVAGQSNVFLKDGQPVRVQRPGAKAIEGAMSAEQVVDEMLKATGGYRGITRAPELIAFMDGKPLTERQKIQSEIGLALEESGRSRTFKYPFGRLDSLALRADFETMRLNPGALGEFSLRLMEDIVAPLRPTEAELMAKSLEYQEAGLDKEEADLKAVKVLDVTSKIRTQAHTDLKQRLADGEYKYSY